MYNKSELAPCGTFSQVGAKIDNYRSHRVPLGSKIYFGS